eukprot:4915210-Pyramimonas_sp.AAC.1
MKQTVRNTQGIRRIKPAVMGAFRAKKVHPPVTIAEEEHKKYVAIAQQQDSMEASPAPYKARAMINELKDLGIGGQNKETITDLGHQLQRASIAEVELMFQPICIVKTFDSEIVKVNVVMCLCPQRRTVVESLK